ncbi:hypothetical protein KP79_PYT20272 [Mizuhopecten yessoensis]|uniref:Uncharacterized protein n=1 Tax=Mizuhopecten yessoensis TaxID=6573 RepID=A0A210R262_MIZYE|nr:hypothetical protein KP79_PYT20272 [Mizuhopecten yessoensis]
MKPRSIRCQTKFVTYYLTEYYCCDGWTETIDGNEVCTKRIPLLHNTVTSYDEVPSLAWRSVSSDEEVIDDRTLPNGVYTAGEFFDIVTTEVDATTIGCGAKRKIWMNDTLPDADGSFHNRTMCVTDADTNNPCKDSFTIAVHNGGSFRVYALETFNSSKYGLENDTVSYCFDLSISRDPCSATIPTSLPGPESHRPGNTDVIQSDAHLSDNWYSVEPYQIVTNSPDLDSPIRCGAKYQLWMNDSFPEVDGKHHLRKLCITDPATSDTCINSVHFTFIKNCDGVFRYFLTSSPKPDSAYCFDIPAIADDPAPDFTPSNVKIDVSLTWIQLGLTSSSLKPSLQFQCSSGHSGLLVRRLLLCGRSLHQYRIRCYCSGSH